MNLKSVGLVVLVKAVILAPVARTYSTRDRHDDHS